MNQISTQQFSKVPELTLMFWVIKIVATTLGETGGDAVSMSTGLGYLPATAVFAVIFMMLVSLQIKASHFRPVIYWAAIIATTTVGTTLADFADRSLGIGYAGGSLLLLSLLVVTLLWWYRSLGTIAVASIVSRKAEIFYWLTIMFSQTLGTALGDWLADTEGFGYGGGALVFISLLMIITGITFFTKISRTLLFWAAFILTRPLGATLGDLLDKPISAGGLELDRYTASAVLLMVIILALTFFKQRPGQAH